MAARQGWPAQRVGCGVTVACGEVVGFGVEVGVNAGAVVGVLDGTTVIVGAGDA